MPVVVWLYRSTDGSRPQLLADLPMLRFDLDQIDEVDDLPGLRVGSGDGTIEVEAGDDATSVVVVAEIAPSEVPQVSVAGRTRLVVWVGRMPGELPVSDLENLCAVDDVLTPTREVTDAVASAGVPKFMVSDVPAGQLGEWVRGLQAHDFRGGGPATVSFGAGRWARSKVPSRASIAAHGVNAMLAEFGRIPPFEVRDKKRAYDRASNLRRAHPVSASAIESRPVLAQLDRAMRTPMRNPRKKAMALMKLERTASALEPGDPRLGTAIQELWESHSGLFEPTDEFMSRRKAVWDRFGAVPTTEEDADRLGELQDRHQGERIFILGNGPSLNDLDLDRLVDDFTFGVNRISLLFDRVSWRPAFWTVTDWRVGPQMRDSYQDLSGITKFVPYRFRGVLPVDEDTYWYHTRRVGPHFADQFELDVTRGIPSRATVLVTAIQQAFFLGFREIYLIGADASYTIPQSVIQTGPDRFGTGVKLNLESTQDDDINHFDPRYFGTGARWHDPNVEDMLRMFRLMRKGVEFHGGTIKNATAGGNLEVFERVPFGSLF